MLDENVGCNESQEVVNDWPVIELVLDALHQMVLDSLNGYSIVLESESLVFIMNQWFPKPYRKHYFLPEWNLMMMVVVCIELSKELLHLNNWFVLLNLFFIWLFKFFEGLSIAFLIEIISNLQKSFIVLQKTKEDFVLLIFDRVVPDIQYLQVLVC